MVPENLADFIICWSTELDQEKSPLTPNEYLGIKRYVLPHMPPALVERIRKALRSRITPQNWPSGTGYAPEFELAAHLGMQAGLRAVLEYLPDDAFDEGKYYSSFMEPLGIVFGLDDPARVESEVRRLKLVLHSADHIRAWIAHTETRALDKVVESVLAAKNRDECELRLQAFGEIEAPEAAGPMLELCLKSKAPRTARAWLEDHPAHAIRGLVGALAKGCSRAASDAAFEILNGFKRRGAGNAIEQIIAALPPATAEKIRGQITGATIVEIEPLDARSTPKDLASALASAESLTARTPRWAQPEDLPPIRIGDRRLNKAQTEVGGFQAIGLAHPLQLTEALKSTWGDVLSSYNLISPFPQYGPYGDPIGERRGEEDGDRAG